MQKLKWVYMSLLAMGVMVCGCSTDDEGNGRYLDETLGTETVMCSGCRTQYDCEVRNEKQIFDGTVIKVTCYDVKDHATKTKIRATSALSNTAFYVRWNCKKCGKSLEWELPLSDKVRIYTEYMLIPPERIK